MSPSIVPCPSPAILKIAAGHECIREVAGHPYAVTVWTNPQWECLPESKRPPTAQRIGTLGWIDLTPAAP